MTPEHRARIMCEEFACGKWEPGVTLEQKIAEAIHQAVREALVEIGALTDRDSQEDASEKP